MRDYTTIKRNHVYNYTSDYTHDYARLCKIMLFDYSDYVTCRHLENGNLHTGLLDPIMEE